jgi:hypothetical protein
MNIIKPKILFILPILIMLYSCSPSKEEYASKISTEICKKLTQDFSPNGIMEAKKYMQETIDNDKKFVNNVEFYKILSDSLEKCFRSLHYSKIIFADKNNLEILGSCSKYFQLADNKSELFLDGKESGSFKLNLKIESKKQLISDKLQSIEGKINLIDGSGELIKDYKIYQTSDLMKLITSGKGETGLSIYLAPIWINSDKDIFDIAAHSLTEMDQLNNYKIILNFNFNGDSIPKELIDKTDDYVIRDLKF